MQLNKVLKGLMLVLPIMAIAACSSKKQPTTRMAKVCWVRALV